MHEIVKLSPPFAEDNLIYILFHLTPYSTDCTGDIGIVKEVDEGGDPVKIRCTKCHKDGVVWQSVDPKNTTL